MFGFNNKSQAGAVVIGGRHVADTHQCVHCGAHWTNIPGSGRKHLWCPNCHGLTCSKESCRKVCIPYEAKLDYADALTAGQQKVINRLLSKYPAIGRIGL